MLATQTDTQWGSWDNGNVRHTGSVSVERRSTWYFGGLGDMLSHWVCECGAEKYLVLWKVGGYALPLGL